MPSHTSLHISLNVCHVISHHPPSPHDPPTPYHPSTPPTHSHATLHISPNVCHVTSHHPPHPTQAFPCIPTHIPQCLSCYFTPTTHPTHAFPCIPTHIPQCLSCYITPPTLPHPGPHTPPHTSNPHLPTHPYPTLHLKLNIINGKVFEHYSITFKNLGCL